MASLSIKVFFLVVISPHFVFLRSSSQNITSSDHDPISHHRPRLNLGDISSGGHGKASLFSNYLTSKFPAALRRYRFAKNPNFLRPTTPPPSSFKTRFVFAEGPFQVAHKEAAAMDSREWTPKSKRLLEWLVGFLAGMVAGTLAGMTFSVAAKFAADYIKKWGKDTGPWIYSPLIKNAGDLAFLEKEDGITSLKLIGRGGCGEVYKAELPNSSGKMIAIKKIIQQPRDSFELGLDEVSRKTKQIRSEINTVSKLRHRNLLPLLAHVSRGDCDYLVYEFMKNGSLQEMMEEVGRGRVLDWPARHRIAVGVAAGLEHLHTCQSPRIVHRDLKPANILLDDEMEARIADFGLAKTIPVESTHASSSNVAGTVGYIAPEYHQTLKLTDRCDVYSLGVVVGVLVMGKLPSDEFFQDGEEGGLVKWMRRVMRSENPVEGVDTGLLRGGGMAMVQEVVMALRIACFCTMDDPMKRPSSKEVRCMLAQIR